MAKKKAAPKRPAPGAKRLDPAAYGIDLQAILSEIRGHLSGTQQQIADSAGIRQSYVGEMFVGSRQPSLGALAALADAAGGKLELTFKPPPRRRRRRD